MSKFDIDCNKLYTLDLLIMSINVSLSPGLEKWARSKIEQGKISPLNMQKIIDDAEAEFLSKDAK